MRDELLEGLVLKRKVDFEVWRIKGTVSMAENRPEYMPVLQQLSDRGPCTDSDVAEHLLFSREGRKAVAGRMLENAKVLGLADRDRYAYSLTEAGEDSLRKKRVFVPQEGIWEVWVSADLLLPFQIIKLEPYKEPRAYQEMRHQNKQSRNIKDLHWKIKDLLRGAAGITCVGGKEIKIESIEKKAECVEHKVDIRIEWDVLKKSIRLQEGENWHPLAPPAVDLNALWLDLLDSCCIRQGWDENSGSLRRSFNDVETEQARFSMKEIIAVSKPQISGAGSFEKVSLKEVPISAATQKDAQRWADWRLMNGINRLMTSKRYAELCANAKRPFEEFAVELPTRDKLAGMLWANKKGDRAWRLMAAADWAL